jgi:hypothetical protein
VTQRDWNVENALFSRTLVSFLLVDYILQLKNDWSALQQSHMALPATQFEARFMEERAGRLEDCVEQVQANVAKIDIDIRRIDGKVDAVKDAVTKLQVQAKDDFIAILERIAATERALRGDFTTLIGAVRERGSEERDR